MKRVVLPLLMTQSLPSISTYFIHMIIERLNINQRKIQTTVHLPLCVYMELVEIAKREGVSLSELVRRALSTVYRVEEEGLDKN
jgi:hypothetical protein